MPHDVARRQSTRVPGDVTRSGRNGREAGSGRHLGLIVAGSLAVGPLAAVGLVAAPFVPPTESGVTGAVLCGLALGWAVLAVLSVRTDQPQRWAAAPALVMGVSGVLLVAFGSPVHEVLAWVWPPTVLALVVWMVVRARRHLSSAGGRWLIYPVIAVLALASVGGGYQTVRAAVDAGAHPMPGRLVDVGGHRLHLSCTGSGGPTVVVEPGGGGVSADLDLVTRAVAHGTRVCVYDRAGRGWSDPADTPQDATQIATDLHTLLHRAQVPGPYVLAGHSFGGLYALTFAARYHDEVAGMVLIDSTAPAAAPAAGSGVASEAEVAPSRDSRADDLVGRVSALVSSSARLGLGRLVGVPTASHLRSTIDEYVLADSSMLAAASLRDLGDKPLVVVTAGVGHDAQWSAQQDALTTLSTDSVHRVVAGTDHGGVIGDEEGAAATARAILDVVYAVRTARPLVG